MRERSGSRPGHPNVSFVRYNRVGRRVTSAVAERDHHMSRTLESESGSLPFNAGTGDLVELKRGMRLTGDKTSDSEDAQAN